MLRLAGFETGSRLCSSMLCEQIHTQTHTHTHVQWPYPAGEYYVYRRILSGELPTAFTGKASKKICFLYDRKEQKTKPPNTMKTTKTASGLA